jgi:hypothetical protein
MALTRSPGDTSPRHGLSIGERAVSICERLGKSVRLVRPPPPYYTHFRKPVLLESAAPKGSDSDDSECGVQREIRV